MIPELVAVLRRVDPDITDKDIADALWLALEIRKAVGRPEPDERKPSDDKVTPPEAANELLAKDKTSPPPEPSPSKRSTRSSKSPTSGLYPGSSSESSDGQQLSALPFRSPAATALPGALDIARTLRSFRKRVPQRTQFVLNEEATAKRIAEEDIWVPVLDYASTRWLEVALVVDIGASMTIWRQTLIELRRLLACHGAFRDVRLWELDTNDHERVWLYAGAGEGIQQRQPRRELELIDTGGRRLILVVTDCVSAAWHSGAVADVLAKWGRYNPVTLLQVLPQRLWSRTALGMADSVRLHASVPGAANMQLHVQATQYWSDEETLPTVSVPIVTLEPAPLAAWSQAIARAGDVWIPGFEFVIPSQAAVEQGQNGYTLYEESVSVALSAAERVQRFRAHASDPAQRLAGLLAMLPVTLPIIRLVQQVMFSEPRQVHVAEVFLSGLLKVMSPHAETLDPDDVRYDFVDSVRENLLNFVSPNDSDSVLTEIATFITSKFAHPLDFGALLANPLGKEGIVIDKENRPFALMGAKALRRFGGEYVELADWLEEQAGEASVEEQPTGSATSVGIGLPYKVDGEEQVRGEGVDASKQGVVGDRAARVSVEAVAQEIIDSGRVVESDVLESNDAITTNIDKSVTEDLEVAEEIVHEKVPVEEEKAAETKDFFISYHSADQNWAEWITWQLEEAHYAVELRAWNFQPGANFIEELDTILKIARRIIFVLSPDYLNALASMPGWVPAFLPNPRSEAEQGTLIALQVRQCISELENLLGEIVYIDLVGLNEEEARGTLYVGVYQRQNKPLVSSGRVYHTIATPPPFPGQSRKPADVSLDANLRIFIIHSSKDNQFGIKIVEDLRHVLGDDSAVWYDTLGGLLAADAGWRKIVEELGSRNAYIIVLSPDAMASAWVNAEVDIAWKRKHTIAGSTNLIIPILYRECEVRDDLKILHMVSFLSPRNYEEAFNELLIALGLLQKAKEQWKEEGDIHYKAKRYKAALAAYEQVLSIDFNDVFAWGTKGNVLARLRRYDEALTAYDKALELDPQQSAIWEARGGILKKLRRYAEALVAYDHALALNSNDAATWIAKGNTLNRLRLYEEALSAYDAALALKPTDSVAWEARGKILYRLGRYEESLAAYAAASAIAPKRTSIWANRGDVLFRLERYEEALTDYERASFLNPASASIARKYDILRELKHHREELAAMERTEVAKGEVSSFTPAQTQHIGEVAEDTAYSNVADVFLSYSHVDSEWVENLAQRLEDEVGFRVWLDKWKLIPGQVWQTGTARAMEQSLCCVICIGEQTPSSWFDQEIRRALDRQSKAPSFRVIPIVLPGTQDIPDRFTELRTWVDFRQFDYDYALHLLVSGIKGEPPGRWPPEEKMNTATSVEEKLKQLRQFRLEGIIDKDLLVEYQRIVLEKVWLSSPEQEEVAEDE